MIERKGAEPEKLHVYENECGILFEDPNELGEGLHLAMAWSGNAPGAGSARTGWLQAITAGSTLELMEAARTCTQPTLCWVAADRAGHIGLQGCGRFPKRGSGYDGLTPIPAWDEANHWQGWLSDDLLPREYDPPEGYVATANEERNRPGEPLLVTQPLPD